MICIQCTCQEICDIKNPLRSHKAKLINKVYLRSPGPSRDNNRERLLGMCGEDGQDGTDFSYSTPTLPSDQWCNPCTNQGDEEHSSSPPPSPIPTSPCPSRIPTPTCAPVPPAASESPGPDKTPCTSDLDVLKLPSSSEEEERESRSGAEELPDPVETEGCLRKTNLDSLRPPKQTTW